MRASALGPVADEFGDGDEGLEAGPPPPRILAFCSIEALCDRWDPAAGHRRASGRARSALPFPPGCGRHGTETAHELRKIGAGIAGRIHRLVNTWRPASQVSTFKCVAPWQVGTSPANGCAELGQDPNAPAAGVHIAAVDWRCWMNGKKGFCLFGEWSRPDRFSQISKSARPLDSLHSTPTPEIQSQCPGGRRCSGTRRYETLATKSPSNGNGESRKNFPLRRLTDIPHPTPTSLHPRLLPAWLYLGSLFGRTIGLFMVRSER